MEFNRVSMYMHAYYSLIYRKYYLLKPFNQCSSIWYLQTLTKTFLFQWYQNILMNWRLLFERQFHIKIQTWFMGKLFIWESIIIMHFTLLILFRHDGVLDLNYSCSPPGYKPFQTNFKLRPPVNPVTSAWVSSSLPIHRFISRHAHSTHTHTHTD